MRFKKAHTRPHNPTQRNITRQNATHSDQSQQKPTHAHTTQPNPAQHSTTNTTPVEGNQHRSEVRHGILAPRWPNNRHHNLVVPARPSQIHGRLAPLRPLVLTPAVSRVDARNTWTETSKTRQNKKGGERRKIIFYEVCKSLLVQPLSQPVRHNLVLLYSYAYFLKFCFTKLQTGKRFWET